MTKLTAKRALTGCNVSHSMRHTKRRQNVNLQTKRVDGKKIELAACEWKTLKKASKAA